MKTTEISCQCGAVKANVSGEPATQFYCHCDPCQADSGGAYVSVAVYPAESVKLTQGEPVTWEDKVRCGHCGTHLITEVEALGMRGVKANLLPSGLFQPTFHQHCSDAVLPVRDDLPHYKSYPPAFGGTDETVDW